VDPAVAIDERTEALGVRRAELLDLAVLEDLVDDQVRAAELFEHGRVGGVPSTGPAPARQLQLREQELLQLLRRADPEVVADGRVRLTLDPRDLSGELRRERREVPRVDRDPGLLHVDEDVDQRQLDLVEQLREPEAVEVPAEQRGEAVRGDGGRAGPGEPLVERRPEILVLPVGRRECRHLEVQPLGREVVKEVLASARVHEIGRDDGVHLDAQQIGAGAAQRAPSGLRVVHELPDARVSEQLDDRRGDGLADGEIAGRLPDGEPETEQARRPLRVDIGEHRDPASFARPLEVAGRVEVDEQRHLDRCGDRAGQSERQLAAAGDLCRLRGLDREQRGRRRGRGGVAIGGRKARDEAAELEVAEELDHRRSVVRAAAGALDVERHRHVRDDARHLTAVEDLLVARLERRAQLRRERREIRVDALDGPVVGDELRGGLLADPGHTRDVVGRVALERLVVDHLIGPEAKALHYFLFVVDNGVLEPLARGHELHVTGDELQGVEVAGEDDRVEAGRLGLPREGADDVVGLEPGKRVHRHAELLKELLAALELRAEIVRHRLAGGLVGGVALLAKCRDREVKAGRDVLRRVLLDDLQEDGREAERGVHELALGRRERRDREVAAVDEAVGVRQEKTLGHVLSIAGARSLPI